MASSITTAAAFTTTNMKPDPGEQADALWAQKLADNSGYLYYRETAGPTVSYQHQYNPLDGIAGTYFFKKQPGLGTFVGSFTGFVGVGANTITLNLKVNGTTFHTAAHNGTFLKFGTAVNVSGLTDGNVYELTYSVVPTSSNTGSCMLALTTWFKP